jgi:hypothetical protein
LIDWWISEAPPDSHHWALGSGPSFGYRKRGENGGGQCDAILVEGNVSKGVVEVEGSRLEYTLRKIGNYFKAEYSDLEGLEFGIFLAYAYGPVGKRKERTIPTLPLESLVECGKEITGEYPGKQLAILALDKVWEPQRSGPRARNEYYFGRPSQITGSLLKNGEEVVRRCLAESPPDFCS